MSDDITQSVFEILCANSPNPVTSISADTVLAQIGLGSLEVVETVFDLEERFDITIPNPGESDVVNTEFKTAGEVADAVKILIQQSSQ